MQPNEKEMLAYNMKKIIMNITNNRFQQTKIFQSLTSQDIHKILDNFDDPDPTLRKLSARLISELLFDNSPLKEKFAENLHISPLLGNVVVNKIPQALKVTPRKLIEVMKLLRTTSTGKEERCLCWFIDPQLPTMAIQRVYLNTFIIGDFIDPSECLFGISYEESVEPKPSQVSNSEPAATDSKYYIRSTYDKPRLTFNSRDKANISLEYSDYKPQERMGELSFKTDRYPNREKPRIITAITDRLPVPGYSEGKSKELDLFKSKHKQGIEVTTPTSVISRREFEDRNQDRHIIVLGGRTQQTPLTTHTPYMPHNPLHESSDSGYKGYTLGLKSPTVSNYISTSLSSTSPKLETRASVRVRRKEEGDTKLYGDYRPSDDFMRKIMGSVRARD